MRKKSPLLGSLFLLYPVLSERESHVDTPFCKLRLCAFTENEAILAAQAHGEGLVEPVLQRALCKGAEEVLVPIGGRDTRAVGEESTHTKIEGDLTQIDVEHRGC
ncbi:hypothetical protein SDC9_177664 [bioreactor metagenome]|uniref:Uncharacterized protein n=1 Tax=bioreactor metagenome TaxID=1076179 RepID=A0A645GTN7_9ZZZZ